MCAKCALDKKEGGDRQELEYIDSCGGCDDDAFDDGENCVALCMYLEPL